MFNTPCVLHDACHMSCVMQHVSHVRCQVSRFTDNIFIFYIYNFSLFVLEQVSGGFVINGATPFSFPPYALLPCSHCNLYDHWCLATCHPVQSHLMACLQKCLQSTESNVWLSAVLTLHLDFLQPRGHTTTPEQELNSSKLRGYFCSRRNYFCMDEKLHGPGKDGGAT